MKNRIKMNLILMLFVFVYTWTSPAARTTNQNTEQGKCSTVGLEKLSSKDMRSRLKRSQPIDAPCCGRNLDLKGTIVLLVAVGETGDTTCVELVSGSPMIANSTIHSVAKWKFQPLAKGHTKPFYGHLAIKFHATERAVTFKVIDEPQMVPPPMMR